MKPLGSILERGIWSEVAELRMVPSRDRRQMRRMAHQIFNLHLKPRARSFSNLTRNVADETKLFRGHCEEPLRRSNPFSPAGDMDCLAEPVIGRRFAPTRWLAM